MPGFVEVTIARVRVANVYSGAYFNDFIKAGIARDIKKLKISYGMKQISQRFVCFERLGISVNCNLVKKLAVSKKFWRLL